MQTENKPGYDDGVYVKLYSTNMSDIGSKTVDEELSIHSKAYHRVWMLAEIEVLNEDNVDKLKKYWDNYDD